MQEHKIQNSIMLGVLTECSALDKSPRALDKREYLMIIFSYFSLKPYVVTTHLSRLAETVQMRGHNIRF